MILTKGVKNFKDTYIMDIESDITIKSAGLDTGDALTSKLNTAHKPLGLAEDVGSHKDNWSITSIDVVFTVLLLVCEVYVVINIHRWYPWRGKDGLRIFYRQSDEFVNWGSVNLSISFPVSAGTSIGKLYPPSLPSTAYFLC